MAGACVAHHFRFQVDEDVRGGHEVVFEFSAERAIEASEDARWDVGVSGLRGKGDLEHGSDERSGDAVTGDIGDQNPDVLVIDHQKIVEIACYGAHGEVTGGDFETGEAWEFARKKGRLDLAGNFEFFVDGEEALFVDEGAARGDVAEASDANEEAEELDVLAWQDVQRLQVGVEDKEQPDEKTGDHNANLDSNRPVWSCTSASEKYDEARADNSSQNENVICWVQLGNPHPSERRENSEYREDGLDGDQPAKEAAKRIARKLVNEEANRDIDRTGDEPNEGLPSPRRSLEKDLNYTLLSEQTNTVKDGDQSKVDEREVTRLAPQRKQRDG